MKPCVKNRKPIAWMAVGALETGQAEALRAHLAQCEGCRRYSEEISSVTTRLASAQADSELEASGAFLRGVARKLQDAPAASPIGNLLSFLRLSGLLWRLTLPVAGALMIALLILFIPHRHSSSPEPESVTAQIAVSDAGLAPTIANYQMVAHQSLDKLSDLLTEQGNQKLPPAPLYTASGVKASEATY